MRLKIYPICAAELFVEQFFGIPILIGQTLRRANGAKIMSLDYRGAAESKPSWILIYTHNFHHGFNISLLYRNLSFQPGTCICIWKYLRYHHKLYPAQSTPFLSSCNQPHNFVDMNEASDPADTGSKSRKRNSFGRSTNGKPLFSLLKEPIWIFLSNDAPSLYSTMRVNELQPYSSC